MKEFNLQQFLANYENESVDFFRFPGNYGDSLIWHGTKMLLSSLNIYPLQVDIMSKKYNDTLLIDGGGNLVDYYSDIANFLLKKSGLYENIVILPHTIFGDKQIKLLNTIKPRLTIFARENITAKLLQKQLQHGDVYLWHDCALYNKLQKPPKGFGALNVFRTDIESAFSKLPKDNFDISTQGYATKKLDSMVSKLQKYEQVYTDRLHIAIGALLLGKQVKLYPNSYYKNSAVFEYSLKTFKNIDFINDISF